MDRYGYAVAEVVDGACRSCNMSVSTQMASAIEESNDIYVCENCGKYLVAARKEKVVREKAEKSEKEKTAGKKLKVKNRKKRPERKTSQKVSPRLITTRLTRLAPA